MFLGSYVPIHLNSCTRTCVSVYPCIQYMWIVSVGMAGSFGAHYMVTLTGAPGIQSVPMSDGGQTMESGSVLNSVIW